ncbi:MAG TPA: MBL fold metallo-hydrolase [Nitrososphaeria archaeon]|nr:MBL fold metallo-hydrolase [Nitrososphaeria archaeon]
MKFIEFQPIWFDSLGAKSACTLVKTPDASILIDPGAAEMQPSFPAPKKLKRRWLEEAKAAIRRAAEKADVVIITHYHYDHFTDFDEKLYRGKTILAKDPNQYINDSQRSRAEKFYDNLLRRFGGFKLKDVLKPLEKARSYPDPLEDLPIARSRDYGDYAERKKELLELGRKWFLKRVERWNELMQIPELELDKCKVRFADSKTFRIGDTLIKFSKPEFHGIEYARVGWVISVEIIHENEKLLHTSDLEGPVIEDQAQRIIEEDPNILIVDGPSTYLIPYMLNLINLRRAIENMKKIVEDTSPELIIYDHHLPREPRYRERVKEVYEAAKTEGKRVLTAAEYLGKEPVVLVFSKAS